MLSDQELEQGYTAAPGIGRQTIRKVHNCPHRLTTIACNGLQGHPRSMILI